MKSTSSGSQGSQGSFASDFNNLTSSIRSSQSVVLNGAKRLVGDTTKRLQLVKAHVKSGGTLTKRQRAKFSPAERVVVSALEIGHDPDVKKAAARVNKSVERGVSALKDIFANKK